MLSSWNCDYKKRDITTKVTLEKLTWELHGGRSDHGEDFCPSPCCNDTAESNYKLKIAYPFGQSPFHIFLRLVCFHAGNDSFRMHRQGTLSDHECSSEWMDKELFYTLNTASLSESLLVRPHSWTWKVHRNYYKSPKVVPPSCNSYWYFTDYLNMKSEGSDRVTDAMFYTSLYRKKNFK